MATLRASLDGTILQFLANPRMEDRYADPPPEAVYGLYLCEHSNPGLFADLQAGVGGYTLSGSVLLKDAVPVPVASSCQDCTDRRSVPALLTKLDAGADLAADELRCALRYTFRRLDLSP